ncbi:GDP-mannose 4,6 dehydratase [Anas platyrhynchos]|uniref:GDP-mannose 4,6-dehydratase n=1 Tax=Anas platyrhynchos TaxID=8839 RepID=R0JNJ5_ANAPL|nr:GDP-mannose 4,6 dehydratase [Anas platyrhynchos]
MWLMLQTDEPEDFVIATGEVHSVREFVEKSFKHIGKTIVWEGKNENEVGRCKETGKIHVTVNHKYYRPTEVPGKSEAVCHSERKRKVDMGVRTEIQESTSFTTVEIHSSEDLCALEEQPKGVGDG